MLLGIYYEMELRNLKKRTEKRFSNMRVGLETLIVNRFGGGDRLMDRYASILDGDASSSGGSVGRTAILIFAIIFVH